MLMALALILAASCSFFLRTSAEPPPPPPPPPPPSAAAGGGGGRTAWQDTEPTVTYAPTASNHHESGAPPRGWNSYDSFTWFVNESQFLRNCKYMADHLLDYGYDTCVIDYLWYQTSTTGEWLLDDYCRPRPDPERWPSSRNGTGFRTVAAQVHSMGLKFGIHIMRGTSSFAATKNCLIKGAQPKARIRDVAATPCSWCTYSLSVNVSTPAGVQFYESLLEQYAIEWNVDFLKNDCVFGSQFVLPEVTIQSRILESLAATHSVDLVYSLSPGGHNTAREIVAKGRQVSSLVSMYRVNNDDWDNEAALAGHFDVAAAFANARLAGRLGLNGRPSFPDFDMLPLGYITSPSGNQSHYPYHMSNLTRGEQRMQMTLWGIAPSPLFFGGDLPRMDAFTYSLLTNADILWLNNAATKSEEIRHNDSGNVRTWRAQRQGMASIAVAHQDNITKYVAVFNVGSVATSEVLVAADFGAQLDPNSNCTIINVWTGNYIGDLRIATEIKVKVPAHDVAFLKAECHY